VRSELRRLRTLARQRGLCPTHMATLACGCTRRWTWTGTADEWEEYGRLFDRVLPITAALYVHGTCHRCQRDRYCEACGRERLAQGPNPFSEDEMIRLLALMELLQPEEPDDAL
jgi:hypothetical protein